MTFFLYFKEIHLKKNIILIKKGSNLKSISSTILENHLYIDIYLYYYYLRLWNIFSNLNYGEFKIDNHHNLYEITKIISKPSNVFYNLTVIDGWQKFQLNNLLNKKFNSLNEIKYESILADTYQYRSTDNYTNLINLMKNNKDELFYKHKNNILFKKYSEIEIMTIASLVEKEGIDDLDKKLISSVIINRLEKKMKLQIDASTIFSITKGGYKFDRKLTKKDLKIEDEFNTYYILALPPHPICYVSRKTIELVLDNYKSDYLFYFYNSILKKHVYSKTYEEHKQKLIKYRNEKKQ